MKSQSSQLFLYYVPTQGAKCTSLHRHNLEGDLGWLPSKGKEERVWKELFRRLCSSSFTAGLLHSGSSTWGYRGQRNANTSETTEMDKEQAQTQSFKLSLHICS